MWLEEKTLLGIPTTHKVVDHSLNTVIHSPIHLFSKCILSTYYLPSTVLALHIKKKKINKKKMILGTNIDTDLVEEIMSHGVLREYNGKV